MNKEELIKKIREMMAFEFNESIRCESLSVQYSETNVEWSLFYYNLATTFTHGWAVLRKLLEEIKNGKI